MNLIRAQLKPVLNNIMNKIMHQFHNKLHQKDNLGVPFKNGTERKYLYSDENKQNFIMKYCKQRIINDESFWPQKIQKMNYKLQRKYIDGNNYGLFDESIANINSLNIDRFQIPIFKQFVSFFFVNTDQDKHQKIIQSTTTINGTDRVWYRDFLENWRETPSWYTYDHDVLLLELALRNGLNIDEIIKDLSGDKIMEYKIRFGCQEIEDINDAYHQFKKWCNSKCNVIKRLKYITNIIVKNLQNKKYGGNLSLISIRIRQKKDRPKYRISSLLFTDYQKATYYRYLKKEVEHFMVEGVNDNTDGITLNSNRCCCCNGIFKRICCNTCCAHKIQRSGSGYSLVSEDTGYDENISYHQLQRKLTIVETERIHKKFKQKIHRDYDPFIHRDIDNELSDILKAFDLTIYGPSVFNAIIDQIQQQQDDA